MNYDASNIFAKILKGEIPCRKILENDYALSFHDIHPKAAVHALVIPKAECVNFSDFTAQATELHVDMFWRLVSETARELKLAEFRLIANQGPHAGQEVPHFHVHILGGEKLRSF